MDHAFGVISDKSSLYPRSSRLCYLPGILSFCVLHFGFIFVKGIDLAFFFFFLALLKCFPIPFIEKPTFALMY